MGSGKNWTEFEIEYLRDHWGVSTLKSISRELNRTKTGVFIKAKRERLGASTKADEYMTAHQIAKLLRVEPKTVVKWIKKHNLEAIRKVMLFKKEFWMIKHCDLCEWLEKNQDRFDSRRIELFGLGYEPKWLQAKRERDKGLPKNRFKKWTGLEIQKIIYYSREMDYKEIARIMGRSYFSIERKFDRLKYRTKILERMG